MGYQINLEVMPFEWFRWTMMTKLCIPCNLGAYMNKIYHGVMVEKEWNLSPFTKLNISRIAHYILDTLLYCQFSCEECLQGCICSKEWCILGHEKCVINSIARILRTCSCFDKWIRTCLITLLKITFCF